MGHTLVNPMTARRQGLATSQERVFFSQHMLLVSVGCEPTMAHSIQSMLLVALKKLQ